jgi:hypothetical protein
MKNRICSALPIAFAILAIALFSCAKPEPLDEDNVRALMQKLNAASAARDFAGMKSCYASDAFIDIDMGRSKKKLPLQEYIQSSEKNAGGFKDYNYDSEAMTIRIENLSAIVDQTVVESATVGDGPMRSKTEAKYTVRLVGKKLLIVDVQARVIIAQAAAADALAAPGRDSPEN